MERNQALPIISLKEKALSLPPISRDLRKVIMLHGTMTGSISFGGYIPGVSDIDIILLFDSVASYFPALREQSIISDHYDDSSFYDMYVNSGHVVQGKFVVWNLLIFKDVSAFNIWREASECMQNLVIISPNLFSVFKNKCIRAEMFEMLRKALGSKREE